MHSLIKKSLTLTNNCNNKCKIKKKNLITGKYINLCKKKVTITNEKINSNKNVNSKSDLGGKHL